MIILKKTITLLFLCIICIEILINSNEVINSVLFSFDIWKNNIFPSLFPILIISQFLINYGFVEVLSKIFSPIMKLFKINKNCAFIIIMSLLSGFPANAKYTKELYLNNSINENDASKVLAFSSFSNPLFIIGSISSSFLCNIKVAKIIFISHYLPNVIIGILFRNYMPSINYLNSIKKNKSIKFGELLNNVIKNSIDTLLSILGIITIYLVFTTLLNNIFNLNGLYKGIFNGLFEMTQGLKYVSISNASLKLKTIISCMIISFGGLSVHMQVLTIISDTKIKYMPFFIGRIIHCILSGIICYFIFDFLI